MKRTLAIILAFVLCFQFFAMEASAAEAGISLSSAEGLPGEQVSVNVKITGNTGLAYLKIKVAYDSSALTLISAENTGLLGGTYTTSKTTDVNPYVLQWMAAGNSVGDGIIATLTFKINETAAAGNQTISLLVEECYDEEFNDVTFTPAGGVVTVTKPACNHVWNDGQVTTPAGCETTGVKTYTCTVTGCGETRTETIDATGHTFGEWRETKAPTCTEEGEETRECACGKKETREIAVTSHKYGEWKVTKAATCTEDGEETRECACGAKETRKLAATGHKYGEWKVTKAATCTEKGEETRECACGEKETCEVAATGHKYGEWKVTKAATCTEDGEETRECACGAKETRKLAATGHKYGEWKVTKAATCTEKGEETRECACGEKETREVAATGHKYGEWTVTKAATCTEDGEETRECACGAKETRKVTATGHEYGEWKVTKAATCTEKGEETHECACGEKEIREIVATGHALNIYGKDTTHHWALCDDCDYVGEKEAHDYDYNGVCECGATKPVVEDPDLDDVPKTGDITPYIAMTFVMFLVAMAVAAAFVLKRKAAK